MDFNRLTLKSQEAIAAAQEDARRRGNPEIYPEHLLLALLGQELPRSAEPDEAADRVLERQRVLRAALRRLKAHDRELIARRFLRRETLAQLSEEWSIPISTLHSREKALLARLRREIAREEAQ